MRRQVITTTGLDPEHSYHSDLGHDASFGRLGRSVNPAADTTLGGINQVLDGTLGVGEELDDSFVEMKVDKNDD